MRFKYLVLTLISLLVFAFLGTAFYQIGIAEYGNYEFRFNRFRYDQIVLSVMGAIEPGKDMQHFHFRHLDEAYAIRKVPKNEMIIRGEGRGHTWALREKKGSTKIWIEVLDNGHAGSYGYAWSEDGSAPGWDADRFGERWELGSKLDDHWWKIRFDLD